MVSPHKISKLAPVGVSVGGRRRRLTLAVCEPLFGRVLCDTIETSLGTVKLDLSQSSERLLAFAFENVLRHYRHSALGALIERVSAQRGAGFVDVGANLGMYSAWASHLGMKAYAIEPEPAHARFLQRNTEVFGSHQNTALSDVAGELPLYYEENNPGATSLFPADNYRRGDEAVPVTTFSDLIESGRLGAPDRIELVKIDVEGFEENAVKGMTRFLDSGYRPLIWCEVRGDRTGRNGGSFRPVRQHLANYGYIGTPSFKDNSPRERPDSELANSTVFDMYFSVR